MRLLLLILMPGLEAWQLGGCRIWALVGATSERGALSEPLQARSVRGVHYFAGNVIRTCGK